MNAHVVSGDWVLVDVSAQNLQFVKKKVSLAKNFNKQQFNFQQERYFRDIIFNH